jgi:hypothetical protein
LSRSSVVRAVITDVQQLVIVLVVMLRLLRLTLHPSWRLLCLLLVSRRLAVGSPARRSLPSGSFRRELQPAASLFEQRVVRTVIRGARTFCRCICYHNKTQAVSDSQ